ncbi:MAG: FHA domain-containing protein [Gammaproteobacteria bacterium]|nr:FHA domain-containing protein [Gammaproteobacteria bacterium]
MTKLIVTLDGVNAKEYILNKQRYTIGRDSASDIHLLDDTVSSRHAAIIVDEIVSIKDTGSTNGTFVNSKKIKEAELHSGDVVEIGRHQLRFVDASDQDHQATMVIEAGSAVLEAAKNLPKGRLKALNGPIAGEIVKLEKSFTKVGKQGLQIVVVTRNLEGFFVVPIVSANKEMLAKLNGQIMQKENIKLNDGDIISIAGQEIQFLNGE